LLNSYKFDAESIDTSPSYALSPAELDRKEIHQRKNVEVINIDFGHLSTTSPRSIELHFINEDPMDVQLSIPYVSHPLKLCLEVEASPSNTHVVPPKSPTGECLFYMAGHPLEYFKVSQHYSYTFRIYLVGEEFSQCAENSVCHVRFDLETEYQYTRIVLYYRVTTGVLTLSALDTGEKSNHLLMYVHQPIVFEVTTSYPVATKNFAYVIKQPTLFHVS
jgi:hypothetical protein